MPPYASVVDSCWHVLSADTVLGSHVDRDSGCCAGCVNQRCCCPSAVMADFTIAATDAQSAAAINSSLIDAVQNTGALATCLQVRHILRLSLALGCMALQCSALLSFLQYRMCIQASLLCFALLCFVLLCVALRCTALLRQPSKQEEQIRTSTMMYIPAHECWCSTAQ